MSGDVVERLKGVVRHKRSTYGDVEETVEQEAIAEIEALRAENKKLRYAARLLMKDINDGRLSAKSLLYMDAVLSGREVP